ncbi:MAG: hypothetical protein R2778_17075 [Saprospiraceae bacterium]
MKKIVFGVLIGLFCFKDLTAQRYYEFSPMARQAYREIMSLRFEKAISSLDALKQGEPDNLTRIFLENYLEVLWIGVEDDETAYKRLSDNMDKRLYQLSRGEPRSPYYRYTQAEVRLQWAVLRARFGDELACLNDVKQAYALLEENNRRFPDFMANKKSLGVLHALVGNVPDEYRWTVRLLSGMRGSIEEGLAELASVVSYAKTHDFVFADESLILYAMLLAQLNNQPDKAWSILQSGNLDTGKNPLSAFAFAHLAIRSGHNDRAIKILSDLPRGDDYHPLHYADFLLGVARLHSLDDNAQMPLLRFVDNFSGKNGLKEAYQKLAWNQLLRGNANGYFEYMKQVKLRGVARSDPDKAALREANSGEMPDVLLLKARLLFDGGYYSRAYDLLKNAGGRYDTDSRNKLEYLYRMGRVTQQMDKRELAQSYFKQTIELGEKRPWYFACNAALQLGIMKELALDVQSAQLWFKKCLSIQPEEYATSLHAKAKAGLNRIKRLADD